MTLAAIFVATSLAVLFVALLPVFLRQRRSLLYAKLLAECLERQPEHEREHQEAHGGQFTAALRIGNIANRFGRKIHAAGLPMLPPEERRRRAREALCLQR